MYNFRDTVDGQGPAPIGKYWYHNSTVLILNGIFMV